MNMKHDDGVVDLSDWELDAHPVFSNEYLTKTLGAALQAIFEEEPPWLAFSTVESDPLRLTLLLALAQDDVHYVVSLRDLVREEIEDNTDGYGHVHGEDLAKLAQALRDLATDIDKAIS